MKGVALTLKIKAHLKHYLYKEDAFTVLCWEKKCCGKEKVLDPDLKRDLGRCLGS